MDFLISITKMGHSKHRVIRIREYQGNLGGFEFCQTKCPHTKEGDRYGSDSRCCSTCKANYLTLDNQKVVKEKFGIEALPYPKKYTGNEDHGYWRAGVGCSLPLEYRPAFCLVWWCGDNRMANPALNGLDQSFWEEQYSRRDISTSHSPIELEALGL